MTGVSLSRWTMSYFAAALTALIAAEVLMAVGYGFPNAAIEAPKTLILVHVVAIGWLSLLMCGALFQFVPVLIARPLWSNNLPLPALLCLIAGLVALLLGFLQLDGQIDWNRAFFPLAAVLLGAGFVLVLWNMACTLWPVRPLPLQARFVVVGLFSVAVTATLGIIFALVIGGATVDETFVAVAGPICQFMSSLGSAAGLPSPQWASAIGSSRCSCSRPSLIGRAPAPRFVWERRRWPLQSAAL
jgi:hypothetical protein